VARARPPLDPATCVRDARWRWPGVSLDAAEFAAWVAARVGGGDVPEGAV
jgi:hypothetical protein